MTLLALAALCLALLVPELDAAGEGPFCYDLSKRALWSIEYAYNVLVGVLIVRQITGTLLWPVSSPFPCSDVGLQPTGGARFRLRAHLHCYIPPRC